MARRETGDSTMAILNFRVGNRTERGDASRRGIAYLERTGEYAPAEMAYLERTSEDTIERGDFVSKTHGNLPAWADGDPRKFFMQAEAMERGGSQRQGRWATTWQIALPKELTRDEQWDMGTAFVQTHLAQHAYFCVMHDPVKNGEHQPHLHVMFSERKDDGREHGPMEYFRRPEVGGCAKDRWFSQQSCVEELRMAWADWTNYTLERCGHTERVHPRSLYARGIDRKPEPKIGYSTDPERHAAQHRIRVHRDLEREQIMAHEGWEARKQRLGIVDIHERTRDEVLLATYNRARSRAPGAWESGSNFVSKVERIGKWRTREVAHLERTIPRIEDYLARLQTELTIERAHAIKGRRRSPAGALVVDRVLRDGRALGLGETPVCIAVDRDARLVLPLVGNRESKIYHKPGDPNYGDTVQRRQVLFWSYADAERAGYREAVNQHYGHGEARAMQSQAGHPKRGRARAGLHGQQQGRDALDIPAVSEPDGPTGRAARTRIFGRERGGEWER